MLVHCNRSYLTYIELSKGSYLSAFHWNTGGLWKGQQWEPTLPNDSQVHWWSFYLHYIRKLTYTIQMLKLLILLVEVSFALFGPWYWENVLSFVIITLFLYRLWCTCFVHIWIASFLLIHNIQQMERPSPANIFSSLQNYHVSFRNLSVL